MTKAKTKYDPGALKRLGGLAVLALECGCAPLRPHVSVEPSTPDECLDAIKHTVAETDQHLEICGNRLHDEENQIFRRFGRAQGLVESNYSNEESFHAAVTKGLTPETVTEFLRVMELSDAAYEGCAMPVLWGFARAARQFDGCLGAPLSRVLARYYSEIINAERAAAAEHKGTQ